MMKSKNSRAGTSLEMRLQKVADERKAHNHKLEMFKVYMKDFLRRQSFVVFSLILIFYIAPTIVRFVLKLIF